MIEHIPAAGLLFDYNICDRSTQLWKTHLGIILQTRWIENKNSLPVLINRSLMILFGFKISSIFNTDIIVIVYTQLLCDFQKRDPLLQLYW